MAREGTVRVDIKRSVLQYAPAIEPLMHIIDIAFAAMQEAGWNRK